MQPGMGGGGGGGGGSLMGSLMPRPHTPRGELEYGMCNHCIILWCKCLRTRLLKLPCQPSAIIAILISGGKMY